MKRYILGIALLLGTLPYFAQQIALEDIWLNYKYYQRPVPQPQWMKNSDFYVSGEEGLIVKKTTKENQLVDTLFYSKELNFSDYKLSFNEDMLLLQGPKEKIYRRSYKAPYFLYDIASQTLDTLTQEAVMHGTLSPDGLKFAYVQENNLYLKDLVNDTLITITNDGKKNHIINGSADWVYEEEFMFSKAFYWSPDSKKIAYYRFDESKVPEYNMQIWGNDLYPEDYKYKYPKAGEPASDIQIRGYELATGQVHLLAATTKKEEAFYIPKVCWANHKEVSISFLNRRQNKLELCHVECTRKNVVDEQSVFYPECEQFFVDSSKTYLELVDQVVYANQTWGKLIYINEYGKVVNELHEQYEGIKNTVTAIKSVQDKGFYYEAYSDKEGLEKNLYWWEEGKSKCLTCHIDGTNLAEVSPDGQYLFNKNSTINRPADYTLIDVNNPKDPMAYLNKMRDMMYCFQVENNFAEVELTTVPNEHGDEMNAYIVKPKDFNKKKDYPLIMYVYGGPGHQLVKNEWQGLNMAYHQYLAQHGFVVACVDARGTGGKGVEYQKCTYLNLGDYETQDQIAAAKYFAQKKYIDANRIGIWGWSFGGYLSSLCMFKGADVFKTGIAVAPVTNWKYYDNIYTERYMRQPDENREGYEENSPNSHASKLEGKFLLIHGTADDNVHIQNTMQLQKALIDADKNFEVFFYPDRNHGIYGGNTRHHLYKKMAIFFMNNL